MSIIKNRALSNASVIAVMIASVGLMSRAAVAQSSTDATPETVIVTGSHITTPGFETPTPVTSVSQLELQATAVLNADTLEYEIPALVPNVNYQAIATTPGETSFNLRGLGATRTLLLIDGQRVMPTSYDGTTDANILPISLIKRIDTVTGGASAAYGSDAIAGVVNVILDTEFEGLKGNFQAGESQYHDAQELDASLTFGTAFDGDRGHIVMSGELYSNGGTDFGAARRPYLQGDWAEVANPLYAAGNGQPQNVVLPNMTLAQMTSGGLIDGGPLKGIAFGPGGVPETFEYGGYLSPTANFMQGGSGQSLSPNDSLSPRLGRQNFFTHAEYNITPDLTAWAELSVVHTTAESPITPNYDSGGLTIHNYNPFLPASIVQLMKTDGVTTAPFGRLDLETGYNDSIGHNNDVRWDAGFKGKLGGTWTWDATAQYSANALLYEILNNRNNVLWQNAINVTTNPTTGLPICVSTLTSPNNGCVPTNIFGPNSITPAMSQYFDGTSWNYYPQESWDLSFNVQGVVFHDWAGDVSIATGGEMRRDSIHGTADAISMEKGWRTGNVLPFTGSQQVQEGYIEADVPLLSDLPFVKQLGFNGAFRFTNYELSGNAETWKLGLNYQVTDDLRFRGTNSRDIRAPNLNDLFQAAGSTIGQVNDDLLHETYNVTQGTGGNRALLPEVGITNTVGVVYSPSWFAGFQGSVDYYSIHLHDAISSPGVQGVVDDCYLYGETNLCSAITRSPTTNLITFILNSEYNASTIDMDGVDIEGDYSASVGDVFGWADNLLSSSSWGGDVTVRAVASYLDNFLTTNQNTSVNTVDTGVLPKWKGTLIATYSNSPITVSLTYRYTGGIVYNDSYINGVSINDNNIASRYYFNLGATYQIPHLPEWQLYGTVNNLFNVTPPVNTQGNISPQLSVSQDYDVIGRTFSVGVRFRY